MTFDEMFEKYMKNSSVNKEQARFIWNAAVDQVIISKNEARNENRLKFFDIESVSVHIEVPDYFGESK